MGRLLPPIVRILAGSLSLAVATAYGASYYVNDLSVAGDVYCSAVGSDANSGMAPASPKLTLTNLLASVSLVPGDVVYVDTGSYSGYTTLINPSGVATNPIQFIGSTNRNAGGTVFSRNSAAGNGIAILGSYVNLSDFRIHSSAYGLFIRATGCKVERVIAYSNSLAGIFFQLATSNEVRHSITAWNKNGLESFGNVGQVNFVDNCVVWQNTIGASVQGSGGGGILNISNTVLSVTGVLARGYSVNTGGRVRGNYNAICRREGALVMGEDVQTGFQAYYLSDWQNTYTQEMNSICESAEFANPSLADFHLKSITGRYNPATGTYVTDTVHAAFIDFGSPSHVFSNEPAPNGGRLNIGAFGNTDQASLSRTNPWLQAVSYNDGGEIIATGRFYWTYGAFTNGAKVSVDYSDNNGLTWTTLVSDVAVTGTPISIGLSNVPSTVLGRWRVKSMDSPALFSTNKILVTLRDSTNTTFDLYVNDTNTSGDVYCSAVGSFTNSGLTPGSPLRSIQAVLDAYNLGGGDTIYVDTGDYKGTNATFLVLRSDQGTQDRYLKIIGSTNAIAGGSILDRVSATEDGIRVESRFVELQNLTIHTASKGVYVRDAQNNRFYNILARNCAVGFNGTGTATSNLFAGCVAMNNTIGVGDFGPGNAWDRGVSWSNGTAFSLSTLSSMSVSNSMIAGNTAFAASGVPAGDYNVLWQTLLTSGINNLNEYQKIANAWWRSTYAPPQFASPSTYDFHPQSQGGRVQQSTGTIVTDLVTSILIDFGSPDSPGWTNEPSPNGSRINVGRHGGTGEASRSRTNTWLQVLTYNDGGQLNAFGETVYWNAGAYTSGATVRIEYSSDDGTTWSVIESNLAIDAGSATWNGTNFPSSRFARWRVVSEANTNIYSMTFTNFVFRNGAFAYYLNDEATVGDIYTTAPGNDSNLGTSPGTPKKNLFTLLGQADLEPGDVVYIDTGNYPLAVNVVIGEFDSGQETNPVHLIGSTNIQAGGTSMNRSLSQVGTYGLYFDNAHGIDVANLVFSNAYQGIFVSGGSNLTFRRVETRGTTNAGFRISNARNIRLDRCVAALNETGVKLDSNAGPVSMTHSVVWDPHAVAIEALSGSISISNSVLGVLDSGAVIYRAATTNIGGNFNNLYAVDEAMIGVQTASSNLAEYISGWTHLTGEEGQSLDVYPHFANPSAYDFHLKTQTVGGRYDPFLGFVSDPLTSTLIDSGDPASMAYTNEPSPNGSRINIGLYGGTLEASKGVTAPWLLAASLRSGGSVSGTSSLHWVAANFTNGARVSVEYSRDGGDLWQAIATSVLASAETVVWDSTVVSNSPAGLWRVTSLDVGGPADATTNFFSIRNSPLEIFVNDASTSGDVYTTSAGAPTNWIASASHPLSSLELALSKLNLDAGDRLYVDSGTYTNTSGIVLGLKDSGNPGEGQVHILGSTNCTTATVLLRNNTVSSNAYVMALTRASYVGLSNLVLQGAGNALLVTNSAQIEMERMTIRSSADTGAWVVNSTNVQIRRTALYGHAKTGLRVSRSRQVNLLHSVVVSNGNYAVLIADNTLPVGMTNSILSAHGGQAYLLKLDSPANLVSDYNNLYRDNSASLGIIDGLQRQSLLSWQDASSNDLHSLTHDPEFADAGAGDFHPKSEGGRLNQATCSVVTDAVTSLMIDTGDPLSDASTEPMPNGDRINLGLYGGTIDAGLSRTGRWLIALSFNDGGSVRGTNDLYWIAGGHNTGDTVTLQVSLNGGSTWSNIATGVDALAGFYPNWDTSVYPATLQAVWRVISDTEPSVMDDSDELFKLANGALAYYINDSSVAGDVYTTSAGNSIFDGLDPSTPLPSIGALLSRYELEAGDRVYIDTGNYVLESTLLLDSNLRGSGTNFIYFTGSTNLQAGGSVLNGQGRVHAVEFRETYGVALQNVRVLNATRPVRVGDSTNCILEGVIALGRPGVPESIPIACIEVEDSVGIVFNRCVVMGLTNSVSAGGLSVAESTGVQWLGGISWSNAVGLFARGNSSLIMSNSVIVASGPKSKGVVLDQSSTLVSDYNNYRMIDGALAIQTRRLLFGTVSQPLSFETLQAWQSHSGNDQYSLSHDPGFYSPATYDFHLLSTAGRFVSSIGFTQDTAYSEMIDVGDPAAAFAEEPLPNGSRINLGGFGGTTEASLTPTGGTLTTISFNDGGNAAGTNVAFYWVARGSATNHPLDLQISVNAGVTWTTVAASVSSPGGTYAWDSTSLTSSLQCLWRLVSISNSAIKATSEKPFAIRNRSFSFYLNDTSMVGDVYCAAIGSPSNSGLSPASPLLSLTNLLARYDLEPGDVIYWDTGEYLSTDPTVLSQSDSGVDTNRVVIYGSTNRVDGGTRLVDHGLRLDSVNGVELNDLIIQKPGSPAGVGLEVLTATNVIVHRVQVYGAGSAFSINSSAGVDIDQSVAVSAATNGLNLIGSKDILWNRGILWSNVNAVSGFDGLTLSNSVFAAFKPNQTIFRGSQIHALISDYNNVYVEGGARVAFQSRPTSPFPIPYESLGRWAHDTTNDLHSLSVWPEFADAIQGDFHLRSEAGRFDTMTGNTVTDLVSSLLIDAGNPADDVGSEPVPNGGRANIGLYGSTLEASGTPTGSVLHAVSLNDGGLVSGTNVFLYWSARGPVTAHTFRVEFSAGDGSAWTVLASNLVAGTYAYSWNSTNQPSTPLALWRVVSETDTNLMDVTDSRFTLRNVPLKFYVNDQSSSNDVYCTAVGLPGATGAFPSAPKDSLQALLDTYDMEPGDVVYIDTGDYQLFETVYVGAQDAGVILQGSTNRSSSVTAFYSATDDHDLLTLDQCPNAVVRHLILSGGINGLLADNNSSGVLVEWCEFRGNEIGVTIDLGCINSTLSHCVVRNAAESGVSYTLAGGGHRLLSSVLWSNRGNAVLTRSSSIGVTNSVLASFEPDTFIYRQDDSSTLSANFNAYQLGDSVRMGYKDFTIASTLPYLPLVYETLSRWTAETGSDTRSLVGNPGFVDAAGHDFHLLSSAGFYVRPGGTFSNASETSLLIDAGFGGAEAETGNHGDRINIGLYGGSIEASRTPVDASLTALSMNDAGYALGTGWPLYWNARGAATSHTVRIEFSGNQGQNYIPVVSNVPAQTGGIFWNTTAATSTWLGVWRVVSEVDTNIADRCDTNFAVRNQSLALYLNNNSTAGDVYTSAIGDPANNGTTPGQPRNTLASLLRDFDLEPGDTIYIDTGLYNVTEPVRIDRFDAWSVGTNLNPLIAGGISLRLQGSTNLAAGGSRFLALAGVDCLIVTQALGVSFADLIVDRFPVGDGIGFNLIDSPFCQFDRVTSKNAEIGVSLVESDATRFRNCLIRDNVLRGLFVNTSDDIDWQNGVLWNNKEGVHSTRGSVSVQNSVLGALNLGSFAYVRNDRPGDIGELTADYNCVYTVSNGAVGVLLTLDPIGGGSNIFQNLYRWSQVTGNDSHSMNQNPRFANPAADDFHPQSPAGRYTAASGFITNAADAVSPLLDNGNPASTFIAEPAPNGGRINIGMHGNQGQASLTPTNGSIVLLTLNDGGSADGTITLRWGAVGVTAIQSVYIDFSNDGGATWSNVATNVAANIGSYVWDSIPYGRAAAGLWRVTSQSDTGTVAVSSQFFALRNGGSIPYYVNDLNQNNDMYCTEPGLESNNGFLPRLPKNSIQSLVDSVDLEPGDVVYVDTGAYATNFNVVIGQFDSGGATNPVVFQGSTNGTMISRVTKGGAAVRVFQAENISFQDISLTEGLYGGEVVESASVYFDRIKAFNNQFAGISVDSATNVVLRNSLVYLNATNGLSAAGGQKGGAAVRVENVTFWQNPDSLILGEGSSAEIYNSILFADGSRRRAIVLDAASGSVTGNHNNYVKLNGALIAEKRSNEGINDYYPTLGSWQKAKLMDQQSLTHDPSFVDSVGFDFHLSSRTGYYTDLGVLVVDTSVVQSVLIDAGDPAFAFTNELAPNGNRINIGRYGNTTQASHSPTGSWLLALTFNDGGLVSGTNTLYWTAGGFPTTELVRVEYASDGILYSVLSSNLPVYSTSGYTWDASGEPLTAFAKWRVVSQSNPLILDETDTAFVLKNFQITLYVNDTNTVGDVYTLAPGSATNTGFSPLAPLNDPSVALATYPLSAGDEVFIDTGSYSLSNPSGLFVGQSGNFIEQGVEGLPIRIIGSTNMLSGGTRITGVSGTNKVLLTLRNTKYVEVSHLGLSGGIRGVEIDNGDEVDLIDIRSHQHSSDGFSLAGEGGVRMTRCLAWGNTRWGIIAGNPSLAIEQSVIWSNRAGALSLLENAGTVSVSNSILHAAAPTDYLISVFNLSSYLGNHNLLWPGVGSKLAFERSRAQPFNDLRDFQRTTGNDPDSIVADPLFYSPATGDFHLRSTQGRYNSTNGLFTFDTNTSWAIDLGNPTATYGQELAPNGQRLNLGLYGNTREASKTVTNTAYGEFLVTTMNDGGFIGPTQELRWLVRGVSTSELVYLEFSENNGAGWNVIATNLPAWQRSFTWVAPTSTPLALWRVTSTTNAALTDTVDTNFTIRLAGIRYYVNDSNLVGDVYTTQAGDYLNNGLTPSSAVDSVRTVFDRYNLEPEDIVFVDTGIYPVTNTIVLGKQDSGDTNYTVHITGVTNRYLNGGTRFVNVMTNAFNPEEPISLFRIENGEGVLLSDLIFTGGDVGLELERQRNSVIRDVLVEDGGTAGILATFSSGNRFERAVVTRHVGAGIILADSPSAIDSSVLWSNGGFGLVVNGGSASMSNTIISADGSSSTNVCVNLSDSSLRADFNNYVPFGDARYVAAGGFVFDGLPQWTAFSTQDVHSLSVDPRFFAPESNDFHVLSAHGRFDPVAGVFVTNDLEFSWMLDTGSTNTPVILEPTPNGNRRNIGIHGNTREASKSRTNEWILAITGMAGGRLENTFYLVWTYGNIAATNRVVLDYSVDGGLNWLPVASDVPIQDGQYLWDSLETPPFISPIAKWRVMVSGQTNLVDETDTTFGLNGPFAFYVNDNSLTDDVFTTAVGNTNNLGVSPAAPKTTVQEVLNEWDLEPGDTIYIDTGRYFLNSNDVISITRDDQGDEDENVFIYGSTNGVGTWIGPSSTIDQHEFLDLDASFLTMQDLGFVYGSLSLSGTNLLFSGLRSTNFAYVINGPFVRMTDITIDSGGLDLRSTEGWVSGLNVRTGLVTLAGRDNLMENAVIFGSGQPLVLAVGTNNTMRNNTLFSFRSAFRQTGDDSSTILQNNIIVADGSSNEAFCIEIRGGVVLSDYNNFVNRNGAWIGNANGNWEKLLYWQRESGQDLHSLAHDPLFASEAGLDFHVQSTVGRYDGGGFVTDAQMSPMIDAGAPLTIYTNELVPNGFRVNIGAFGNTAQASKSLVTPWLLAVTMNDGGVIRGTNLLRWIYGAMDATNTIRLEYSANAGGSWTNIATGLSVGDESYLWDTTSAESSLDALWRLVLETDTNVVDETDTLFALRNDVLTFYVNDGSSSNDVYTSALGNNANDGRTPATPKRDLGALLGAYDLEEGDLVLVDAGVYTNTENVLIWSDGGSPEANLVIRGSTNPAALGHTVITRGSLAINNDAFEVRASHVSLENMAIRDAYRGVYVLSNQGVNVSGVLVYSNVFGVVVDQVSSGLVRNIRAWNNTSGGVDLVKSSELRLQNMTLVNNRNFGLRANTLTGSNYIRNTIFYIDQPGQSNPVYALAGESTAIASPNMFLDYNIYYFSPSSTTARIYGDNLDLTVWQRSAFRDYRSAVTNPLFAHVEAGDFLPKSQAGRYAVGTGWVTDAETSWAVDKGDPASAYDLEPFDNGGRINIGAFGNTPFASVGSTSEFVYARVGNETPFVLTEDDDPYPLVWTVLNVDTTTLVNVQYSGDGGTEWVNLATNINLYREYVIFELDPIYNSFKGKWRIIGSGVDTNVYEINDGVIQMYFAPEFRISDIQGTTGGVRTITFPGAWDEDYILERATPGDYDRFTQSYHWTNIFSGPTNLTLGGSTVFVDQTSTNEEKRLYRVIWLGTNGVPFQ